MAAQITGGERTARRLLFCANVDWFFVSHRLPLAIAAREAGWEVVVCAEDTGASGPVAEAGIEFVPAPFVRHGTSPVEDARMLWFLARLFLRRQPHVIHNVAIKPVVYGSLAARVVPRAGVVNALSGLGWVFSDDPAAGLPRRLTETLLRAGLRRGNSVTILQNQETIDGFVSRRILHRDRTVLVPGSGVDTDVFHPAPEPPGPPVVLFASRMLADKGVHEFVGAARVLRGKGVAARFVMAGWPDVGNPTSLTEEEVVAMASSQMVEYVGRRTDMADLVRSAAIVCLPSYHEGVPKVLIEAAASGRATVAADVPGSRDICVPNKTGLLVPPRDPAALAEALATLLADPGLRNRLGRNGRSLVLERFSLDAVVSATLAEYERLCPAP